ncbi:MAG: PEP-CTERM sorting domain-containing protein [Pirellulales bacterium]|nr:PEP-CTERM sorting domain-containing protein [Pirellulales bacterium]
MKRLFCLATFGLALSGLMAGNALASHVLWSLDDTGEDLVDGGWGGWLGHRPGVWIGDAIGGSATSTVTWALGISSPAGSGEFLQNFDLTGYDETKAHIGGLAGAYAQYGYIHNIVLNGATIWSEGDGIAGPVLTANINTYDPPHYRDITFDITSGFVPGVNTISFGVANWYEEEINFLADLDAHLVPEPSSIGLAGLGIGTIGLVALRRRRTSR